MNLFQVQNFPFDTQTCKIRLASWAYDNNSLQLHVSDKEEMVVPPQIMQLESNQWKIVTYYCYEVMLPAKKLANPMAECKIVLARQSFYHLFYLVSIMIGMVKMVTLGILHFVHSEMVILS